MIQSENSKQGTLDWQITTFHIEGLRSKVIEGYASTTSVYPGESIDLMVSTSPVSSFEIDIYRLGYYSGLGGRHLINLGHFKGETQEVPMESVERLRECNWAPATTFQIPHDWISGVYLAKLSCLEGMPAQSYIIFVVKERRACDVVVQASDLTWQAYNKWPKMNSLYDDGIVDGLNYTGPNVRVSFDRPYAKYSQIVDNPLSCGSGSFLLWEYPLLYWLEKEGYDVTYCSNLDLDYDPQVINQSKTFISVGHDEYWTRKMYENASLARDSGVSLLFLSGNSLNHEVITYNNTITGEPYRAFARLKRFLDDKELMGASSFGAGYGDWVVKKPEHWLYENTGMKEGDRIPGLIGWEYHGWPFKEVVGLEVLASSDLIGVRSPTAKVSKYGNPRKSDGKHAGIIYPGPRGNWVFNAGTIWWAQGLSQPPGHIPAKGIYGRVQGADPRVQQMTRNLLFRCINKEK